MITLRLYVEGKGRHPVKAWRVSENPDGTSKSPWALSKEVADYLAMNPDEGDIRIVIEKIITGQSYAQEIPRQFVADNIHIPNGPVIQKIRQAIEALEEAPDLVQERINKGTFN